MWRLPCRWHPEQEFGQLVMPPVLPCTKQAVKPLNALRPGTVLDAWRATTCVVSTACQYPSIGPSALEQLMPRRQHSRQRSQETLFQGGGIAACGSAPITPFMQEMC
jgi:hypothetical protein